MLKSSMNLQEGFMGDGQTLVLKELATDNGVRDAGLIFQADKHMALGRSRSLAADDHTGDGHRLPMLAIDQVGCPRDVRQMGPDKSHGMRTGSDASSIVVGLEAFERIHGKKRSVSIHCSFGGEQIGLVKE